jgi:hypothetical protein
MEGDHGKNVRNTRSKGARRCGGVDKRQREAK